MGRPLRDAQRHTYADYLTWSGDVRYELIDGVAYLMSPAPLRVHQDVVGELFFQVRSALVDQRCRPYIAPIDVRLANADEADDKVDTVVQPDLLVVCDSSKLDARGIRGAPDWIVEVLSPATASHDQTVKLAVYERARVPEVCLVHPTDRVVTVYRLSSGAYGRPDVLEMTGVLEVRAIAGLKVDWRGVLPLLPPQSS
jgi:Uma2 family endonuclease